MTDFLSQASFDLNGALFNTFKLLKKSLLAMILNSDKHTILKFKL